jgi:hypothetical protein
VDEHAVATLQSCNGVFAIAESVGQIKIIVGSFGLSRRHARCKAAAIDAPCANVRLISRMNKKRTRTNHPLVIEN